MSDRGNSCKEHGWFTHMKDGHPTVVDSRECPFCCIESLQAELRLNEGMLELQTERADNNELAWQKEKAAMERVRELHRYNMQSWRTGNLEYHREPEGEWIKAHELDAASESLQAELKQAREGESLTLKAVRKDRDEMIKTLGIAERELSEAEAALERVRDESRRRGSEIIRQGTALERVREWYENHAPALRLSWPVTALELEVAMGDVCEHGKGLTDYCEPCGRIHGGEGESNAGKD